MIRKRIEKGDSMQQILDKYEISILKIIASSDRPLGSWIIENKLKEKNIEISTATIGRVLSKLESNNYLIKERNKGRTITEEGRMAIQKAEVINKINFHKEKIDQIITSELLENFSMVIQARKAIERETVVLATRYITEEELNHLEHILKIQREKSENNESIAEEDIEFHKTIAKASRNIVLESMYNIIATFKQQSRIFEDLREQVNSPYSRYHEKIYEAIRKGDESLARKIMEEHLDNLMKDVLAFWGRYKDEDQSNLVGSEDI